MPSVPSCPVTSTPALLSRDELRALMVGRNPQLRALQASLGEGGTSALVVGEPGMGKSLLLCRFALSVIDEPELVARWEPLLLPPALLAVTGANSLGVAALLALADREEERGRAAQAQALRVEVTGASAESGARLSWDLLRGWCRVEGRGLVIVVDDLDQVTARMDDGGKGLRQLLHEPGPLRLVGSAGRSLAGGDPPHPLAGALREVSLPPLTEDESREVLTRLASPRGARGVLELLSDPGASRALLTVADGQPAALLQLFEALVLGASTELGVVTDRWLDRATTVNALRLSNLAHQAQQLVGGLAALGDPCTAAELAERVGLDVNAVSSQLSRLVRQGVVEKVMLPDSGRTGFQIADRRFSAWLQHRLSPTGRRQVQDLTRFLALLAGADAVDGRANRHLPGALALHAARPGDLDCGALSRTLDGQGDDAGGSDAATGWGRLGDLRKNTLRHYAEAEDAYNRALAIDGERAWVWNNLGNLMRTAYLRPDEAESAYRSALQRHPGLAIAWLNLGNLLGAEAGRPEEAEEAIRRALSLQPSRAEAWASLAELLGREGRDAEAAEAMQEALNRDPNQAPWWCGAAILAERQGLDANAEQAWREAVRRAPEDAQAWTGLGRCQGRRGAGPAAEKALRKAIVLQPSWPAAWRALGELLSGVDSRQNEAEGALRQAVLRATDPAEAAAHDLALAWFLLMTGRGLEEAERRAAALAASYPAAAGPPAVLFGARVRRGALEEAEAALRRLLAGAGPWTEPVFAALLGWISDAAAAGRGAQLAALISEAGLGGRWRPLVEALLARASEGVRLLRLAPELRAPAEQLLSRMRPTPVEAPTKAGREGRPGRKARAGW